MFVAARAQQRAAEEMMMRRRRRRRRHLCTLQFGSPSAAKLATNWRRRGHWLQCTATSSVFSPTPARELRNSTNWNLALQTKRGNAQGTARYQQKLAQHNTTQHKLLLLLPSGVATIIQI